MKKTYKITFMAELTEDDVKAMNGCFYQSMNESMEISEVWGLEMEEVEGEEDGGKAPPTFQQVLGVVTSWFGFMGDEDCENIAQDFAMGISDGRDLMDILIELCSNNNFDVDEFEGICPELEELDGNEPDNGQYGVSQEANDELIGLFQEGLNGWTWESWSGCGATDKEDVARYAFERGTHGVSLEVVYEIFWDWANGLEPDCFEEEEFDEDYEDEEDCEYEDEE